MDRETLEAEAARLGYKLVEISRIKNLEIDLKASEFIPVEHEKGYVDGYIRSRVTNELYDKMAEYQKIGVFTRRYNSDMLYFEISFSLEVIIPNAPTRRRDSGESHPLPIQG